jgi:hypothetical protein
MLCTQAALVVYHTGPLLAISIFRPAPVSAPCLLRVCSVPAPVSASFIRSLYPPSLYVFLLSSELPDYQLRNSLIVSHLNSFYRRLPSVTVFLTEHAPNPRAAVISVYDTNPVNAFSRRMYLHIDCLFRFLCVFSVYVYLYDSARHLSIIPHFFCCQTYCPYDNTSRHKF